MGSSGVASDISFWRSDPSSVESVSTFAISSEKRQTYEQSPLHFHC